jgi:broad specificity phosphatase PhoE
MTRVYVIRHAEAEGNINRIFQAHQNSDVTENGEKQLALLAERCQNMHFDVCYSSDLKRAYKTAQAATKYHNLEINTTPLLREIDGGDWEGVPFDDLPKLFPEHHHIWENEPWRCRLPDGESMQEVCDRMWNVITEIVLKSEGKQILIVSHGCSIRNFICKAMQKPLEQIADVMWCDNTSISIIDFDNNMSPTVIISGDASHLTDETTTLGKQEWWKKK